MNGARIACLERVQSLVVTKAHPTRIAIYGSGAVGGYFGARLAAAGHDVTFIARGTHLEAIRSHGLRVSSPSGDLLVHPATATDHPTTVGPVDIVLVGVKATAVQTAAVAIKPLLKPTTLVLPLQNGVEAATDLIAELGPLPVIGGLCRIASSITEPGHITHTGIEPTIVIGALDGPTDKRLHQLARIFEQAEISVEVTEDIHNALWEKFLLVAPWGGLGGLTRVAIDVICETPETRQLLEASMTEVVAVATAHGVTLSPDVLNRSISFLKNLPAGTTPSMQRDIMAGRPSELDAQMGTLLRLGRQLHVATPVNTFIYHCLLPRERLAHAMT